MPTARPLDRHAQERLMRAVKRPSPVKARALALAAIRETYEETGLMLGAPAPGAPVREAPSAPPGPWAAFAKAQILPDLASIHFVARAITPPRRPKRFDTRFFVYFEDLDLALRARALGLASVYLATAQALHRGGVVICDALHVRRRQGSDLGI